MIKIQYLDLPTGLHVRAEAQGTDTIVYLLPGLTTAQRRAALNRARSSGRMGYGPKLPAARFAGAIAADRMRTTVRNVTAAMRVHPGLVIPPVIITVSAVLAYMLLASTPIAYRGPGAGRGPQPEPVTQGVAPLLPARAAGIRPGRAAPGPVRDRQPGGSSPSPGSASPSPSPSRSPSPSGHGGPLPDPSPSLPVPDPSPTAPVPDPSPSGGSSPSPSPTGSGGVGCMPLGPLGACIHL